MPNKPDIPLSCAGLKSAMEAYIPVGEATDINKSVTGEYYIVYRYIYFDEGRVNEPHEFGEHVAIRKAWTDFLLGVASVGEKAKLYWRITPEACASESECPYIYLRYLISDKPPLCTATELYARLGLNMAPLPNG